MAELPNSSPSRIQALTEKGHWGSDTLHSLLSHQVKNQPNALAVADQPNKESLVGAPSVRLSFKELDIASDALAAQLLEKGAGAESRLLVQLPNIVELVVCFYASSKIGAVISPLPVQYGAHEMRSLGATLCATHFIGCQFFRGQNLAEIAEKALPNIPIWSLGSELECLAAAIDTVSKERLRLHQDQLPDPANRVLTVCWTSGTTGTPKGVPRSANMWIATARATAEAGGYQPCERLLNPFPLVNMAAIGGFCLLLPSWVAP